MRDFEAFQTALMDRRNTGDDGPAYMDSLMNSMSLVLDEFYKHLRVRRLLMFLSQRAQLIDVETRRPSVCQR